MTTERNAQGVDGLAEVMGLLDRAFDMPLRWSENGNIVPLVYTQDCEIAAVYTDREDNGCPNTAAALIAAVNYLRSHGEAIRELVEAARAIKPAECPCKDCARLAAALANIEGGKA